MLKNMVISALFAGFVTGLIVATLQILMVEPIILEAELYETGQLIHFGDVTANMPDIEPEKDWGRSAFSVLATTAVYIGFALLMVATFAFAETKGVEITARKGILWGLAGYGAFQLAPAIGLGPELPGMIAAELVPRQIWWTSTILATGAGIGLIAFGKNWAFWGAGIILIALPHIIGAPHPDVFGGTIPPELESEFAGRTLGLGAVFWAILGLTTAYFWRKETEV